MKTCPNCGAQVADEASFCTACGFNFNTAGAAPAAPEPQYQQPQYQQPVYQQPAASYGECRPVNPCDKVLGIVAVMYSFIGVILAYFGGDVNGQRSEYLRFYANEGLVLAIFSLFSVIPFIGWFLWSPFIFVCNIIAIVNACKGVAKPVLFFGTIRIIH
ncbi:MAG: zinc ribbon domain-containing protein [Lachnospiraceae bacterium]|nr:zinc ribbon domain-containing protein [Lachnospiraceae bacterium]